MIVGLEVLDKRIAAVTNAIDATKSAMNVDRKLSHDKHQKGHYTNALTALTDHQTSLNNMRARLVAVGR
jgi:hypothetical protein